MMYEMKEHYYTGIELLDKGHEKLFQIMESACFIEENTGSKREYYSCSKILDELKQYAIQYFNDEEGYMEHIGYEWIVQHKLKHHIFLEKMEALQMSEKDSSPKNTLLDFFDYLAGWMIDHTLNMDKIIAKSR